MEKNKREIGIYGLSAASLLVLLALFNLVSPDTASPVLILMIFGLIYLIFFGGLLGVYQIISRAFNYVYRGGSVKQSAFCQKKYFYVAILSMAPIVLLALSSIGRVVWYEVVLVLLITVLICFYIYKKS